MHSSSRRDLLRSAALLGGSIFLSRALVACAADADGDPDRDVGQTEDGLVTCRPPVISGNHGHTLVVSAADVAARADKTYSIKGTSSHDHKVTITAAQFTQLGAGRALTVTSTNDAGHSHSVTVTCSVSTTPPSATCRAGASATAISANHGHSLTVPSADVLAGATRTYSIQGSSSHSHQVTITAAQFASLKMGARITVTSSSAMSHVHTVTVACA